MRLAGWLATKSDDAPKFEEIYGSSDVGDILSEAMMGVGGTMGAVFGTVFGSYAVSSLLMGSLTIPMGGALAGVAMYAMGVSIPAMMAGTIMSERKEREIKATAGYALKEFIATHTVFVGPEKKMILIKDLAPTEGASNFIEEITKYIIRFQSSEYN
jgi:hypothetical protein